MKDWNKNEWQGRRKDQYESSAKILVGSFVAIFLILVVSLIYLVCL